MRDPHRDPRKAFRSASGQSSSRVIDDGSLSGRGVGVVGPLAGAGLNMPSVEMAMREMEGGQEQAKKVSDVAEMPETAKVNVVTRQSSGRDVVSPTGEGSSAEVLSNFVSQKLNRAFRRRSCSLAACHSSKALSLDDVRRRVVLQHRNDKFPFLAILT